MDILKDFLGRSTIHGLSHISSSPSKISKCLWCVVTLAGFTAAGFLIKSSYQAWGESPISTSVSTHPLSDLDFPKVAVCPPKDSNTALNYDMLRLSNFTLTTNKREQLSDFVSNIFLKRSAKIYVDNLKAIVNPHNFRALYEGYQSYPIYGDTTYLSSHSGSISTPFYKQENTKNFCRPNILYSYVIELPNLFQGSLHIQLDISTKVDM